MTSKAGVMKADIPEGTRNQLLEGTWHATGVLLDAVDEIDARARALPYVADFSG